MTLWQITSGFSGKGRQKLSALAAFPVAKLPGWKVFDSSVLASRSFVAGADYTVADITAMIAVDFMRVSRMPVPDTLTHLKRWYTAVSERPSYKA